MYRNDKHWLTEEELEHGTFGESLEGAVVEIRNLMSRVEYAFSGVELMAAAIRSKELGFDRDTVFWPSSFPKEEIFGMAWRDDEDLVSQIDPPPDLASGWKLDPLYGDRLRYWHGERWDVLAAPASGNLDVYRRIAAGEEMVEEPEPPPVRPADSDEPHPPVKLLGGDTEPKESTVGTPVGESDDEETTPADLERAEEIAKFVAERAFEFDDHEARAWALTDFSVWSELAGRTAQLAFKPDEEK